MDTQQHNQLIKVCFDGSKNLKHVLSMEEINRMTMIEGRFPLTKLPVCSHCERLAMWSRGMQATCTHCGTITKNPITYATYLASGFDVDTTGATAKSVMQASESMREKILPQYEKVQELIIAGR
jgi:hypothetical protein